MRQNSFLWGRFAGLVLCLALVAGTSGCIYLAVGAVGAVGGYVVSPDTVEGTVNASLGETWDAAKEIMKVMGTVIEENEAVGQIMATISGTKVTITMLTINASSTKLSVKARKSFMPKIDIAQDVYTKIVTGIGGK
jgi:hypothetical protein